MPDLFHQLEQDGPWYNEYAAAPSTAFDEYTQRVLVTNEGVTLTPSIASGSGAHQIGNRLTVTANATVGNNHRELFLSPARTARNMEIRSVLFSGGTWADANARCQQGHVHRWQNLPNGRSRGFVAWHDVAFGLPTGINVGIWEGPVGSVSTDPAGVNINSLLSLAPSKPIPVVFSSRTTNVVTVGLGDYHDLRIDSLIDFANQGGTLNATDARISLVIGSQATFPLTGANVADGGGGFITRKDPLAAFPYVLCSRLIGHTFQAKIYRLGFPEPPWESTASVTWGNANKVSDNLLASGPGMHGIFVGHVSTNESVQFGLPQYRVLG